MQRTPIVLPILDQLDVIDEPPSKVPGLTMVTPEDLIPDYSQYVLGTGDAVGISIFEFFQQGNDWTQGRRIDELGYVNLPILGSLKIAGLTERQAEKVIIAELEKRQQLKNPIVSVMLQEGRQRTYSIIGEPQVTNSAVGTYGIPHADFRIIEAVATARGIPGQVKRLYVIRQVQLSDPENKNEGGKPADQPKGGSDTPTDSADLIKRLTEGLDAEQQVKPPQTQPEAPDAPVPLRGGLEDAQGSQWVNAAGKWVRVETPATAPSPTTAPTQAGARSVQRVIEVPYAKLLEGHMEYNIVIRPNDVIRVPAPVIGNVYVGGAISRPGTYALPGERDLDLKQLMFSAGGVTGTADIRRVDLIRRVGDNQEATVRLDVSKIWKGTAPDFFLKPNDTLNFGTSFIQTPLAVIRSGFRASYGFGFILDRNFEQEVFGNSSSNN